MKPSIHLEVDSDQTGLTYSLVEENGLSTTPGVVTSDLTGGPHPNLVFDVHTRSIDLHIGVSLEEPWKTIEAVELCLDRVAEQAGFEVGETRFTVGGTPDELLAQVLFNEKPCKHRTHPTPHNFGPGWADEVDEFADLGPVKDLKAELAEARDQAARWREEYDELWAKYSRLLDGGA